jgi:hypothetical protein
MSYFVYNLWIVDPYGKLFFYTQADSVEAIEKRRADFTAVYPKQQYHSTLVTILPRTHRLTVWDARLWDDYHEKYVGATVSKPAKKKHNKKPGGETSTAKE